jgi:hypothetical protein
MLHACTNSDRVILLLMVMIVIAKARLAVRMPTDRVYSGAPCLVRLFWAQSLTEIRMGRCYWFECTKCGYRAIVAGRADRGLGLVIQTILCRDCLQLYDVVTRLRIADGLAVSGVDGGLHPARSTRTHPRIATPPTFQSVLNRLPLPGARRSRWVSFKIQCPVSALHRVRSWNDPDRCPKCGTFLEKSALPFRLWD